MTRTRLGQIGEDFACRFLRRHGYAILARRYRTRHGEIDIVVRRGRTLAFVEVKTRRWTAHGAPAEAVTVTKRRRIVHLARDYLAHHPGRGATIRFDVVSVMVPPDGGPARITHLPSAFTLNDC